MAVGAKRMLGRGKTRHPCHVLCVFRSGRLRQCDHAQMNPRGMIGMVYAQPSGEHGTPAATMGEIALIAQAFDHQLVKEVCDGPRPDDLLRLAAEAKAGDAGNNEFDGVRRLTAKARWMGQSVYCVPELKMSAWPTMDKDQRRRIRDLSRDTHEMDDDVVDLGQELRIPVEQPCRLIPI